MPVAAFDLVVIVTVFGLAAIGGEAFLRAIISSVRRLRVLNALVATTIAAFAISTPELTVSTMAALSGRPEIGLRGALGSNVVNIALIFGIALWFGHLRPSNDEFRGDFMVQLLTLMLALDAQLSRVDGLILLLLFSRRLGLTTRIIWHRHHPLSSGPQSLPSSGWPATLGLGALGLVALIAAGCLFVIGALVIAIGTSLPELATVMLSRLRGHDDIGVGTLIGSNLFNDLAIVGVAATIPPLLCPSMK